MITTRFITYKIPENSSYDVLMIYSSATEDGTYVLDDTLAYKWPTRATEYESLDTTKWYKIRFSDGSLYSPYSDAFFGGGYDEEQPFAAITSTFDGAGFSTVDNFYQTTSLNSGIISQTSVTSALRTAKAYIDIITDEFSPYKYSKYYSNDITRRKYNAQLEIAKLAETYFAAALIYSDLADNRTAIGISGSIVNTPSDISSSSIKPYTELEPDALPVKSFSVGQTSFSEGSESQTVEIARFNLDKQLEIARYNDDKNIKFAEANSARYLKEGQFFLTTSSNYAAKAESLLQTLKPTTIPMMYGDSRSTQKFISPTTVFAYSISSGSDSAIFTQNTADLTGLGGSMATFYELTSVIVNGVAGEPVLAYESGTLVVGATLSVNGVLYYLDDWVDSSSLTNVGKDGTTGGTDGFSLSFLTTSTGIRWNYTLANGGFDLEAGDDLTLTYWVV